MPFGTKSSPVTFAATKLTYPIFEAEFDPYDRGYLIVAGGGGENRTGVPNKIVGFEQTLLDVSSREKITEVTEINLSIQEDSPQSLASLATKQGLISLVGISSSLSDQKSGKNEHLRSFDVEFPPKKRAKTDTNDEKSPDKGPRITKAGQTSLFEAPSSRSPKVYQRLLRLSPVKRRDVASKRVGAIATADSAKHELILFDATTFLPNPSSVLHRLQLNSEAEDLDIWDHGSESFTLACCGTSQVSILGFHCDFDTKKSVAKEPAASIYNVKDFAASPTRIRSLRWIGSDHLALVQNCPGSAPELLIIQVNIDGRKGNLVQRKVLPRSMVMGIRLAVCLLDDEPATGERQVVFAVAGQNKSVHVFTANHRPQHSPPFTPLKKFTVLDTSEQHPQSISKLAFSNFFPPLQPKDSPRSIAASTQFIQLASVSVGYTVVVESLALTSTPASPTLTPDNPTAQRDHPDRPAVRWVLSSRSQELLQSWFGIYVAAFGILVLAILSQIVLKSDTRHGMALEPIRGLLSALPLPHSSDLSQAVGSTPASLASVATSASAIISVAVASASSEASKRLEDLLDVHREQLQAEDPAKALLLSEPENPYAKGLIAHLHSDVDRLKEEGAKPFHELDPESKKRWKRRLIDAGQWAEDEGMTILKGVLFSEYAQVVGGAIRDAVLI